MKKLIAIFWFTIMSSFMNAQNYQTIEELNDACSQLGFAGDEEAEIAVDIILDQIGLFRNFTIQECPGINNAEAKNIEISPGHKERYILYDADFFSRIENKTSNDWAAKSILAHEIAHHLNGHALNNTGSNPKWELEADYFSGSAMAKMGATLTEAQSAINTLKYEKATSTHPAKIDRLEAIENGWNKAKGKTTVKTITEGKEDTAFEFYRKGELAYADHNYEQAIIAFTKAKDLGSSDAYYYLSNIYYVGLGTYIDYEKAFQFAKTGYEMGSIPATYQLGKYYSNGIGTKKNEEEAQRLFQKDFQVKWFKDQYNKYKTPFHAYAIGYMYGKGYSGLRQDQQNSVIWYKQAVNNGDVIAQSNLGVMYKDGIGVEKDYYEAVKWFRKSAEQGYAPSQTNLGDMHSDGRGVKKDDYETVKWYRKAVEQGYPRAQTSLGYVYLKGIGVEKDYAEALKLFNKSAEQGDTTAFTNLGVMYYYGYGVTKDEGKAIYWFKKAAREGDKNGQSILTKLGESW